MSISNINHHMSALLSQAYAKDVSAVTGSETTQPLAEALNENSNNSTQVTLGSATSTTGTYTAQGLLTQMRQFQRDNVNILFEDNTANNSDSLFGTADTTSNEAATNIAAMDDHWVDTIRNDPEKASVMVKSSISDSLNTILGGS